MLTIFADAMMTATRSSATPLGENEERKRARMRAQKKYVWQPDLKKDWTPPTQLW
jgi:hypothetical protein